MSAMFWKAYVFNQDLSNWVVTNVNPRSGAYVYNPTKLKIDEDLDGFFYKKIISGVIFPNNKHYEKTVEFKEEDDTFILNNTSVVPQIQIKYEKID